MNLKSDTHKHLNPVLTSKLTSINQFFLHARITKDWGLEALNSVFYKKSIKDMKHADALIERILLLGGLPNLQKLDRLHIGENTTEVFKANATFSAQQHAVIKQAIGDCEQDQDYVSRDLLSDILAYEEEAMDWNDTQLELIENIGIENYLQAQIGEQA